MTNAEITARLTVLKRRRSLYLEAEEAVLSGQEYRNGTFSLKRADLKTIQDTLKALDQEIRQLESPNKGKRAAFRIVPRDI